MEALKSTSIVFGLYATITLIVAFVIWDGKNRKKVLYCVATIGFLVVSCASLWLFFLPPDKFSATAMGCMAGAFAAGVLLLLYAVARLFMLARGAKV
jgi:RsiW-degrading membrane proteinase PrsW (M82 family)